MMQGLMKGILDKKLLVKKGHNITGTICIHFPNPKIQDIHLTDFSVVSIFGRIGMTQDDARKSNLESLLNRGDLLIVG